MNMSDNERSLLAENEKLQAERASLRKAVARARSDILDATFGGRMASREDFTGTLAALRSATGTETTDA